VSRIELEFTEAELDRLADRLADRVVAKLEARDPGPTVYTCATLADELGVTPRAVRAAIDRGDLEAVRRGRGYVITPDAVTAWASPPQRRRRRPRPAATSRPLRDALT
jgi:excisionase family DNA binding protein